MGIEGNGSRLLSELEKEGFEGVDCDLATSLYEYGLIWKKEEHKPEYIMYFGVGVNEEGEYNTFDNGWYSATTEDALSMLDWINWPKILSFLGMEVEEFERVLDAGIFPPMLYFDLMSYYGSEEIFGTPYDTFTIENDT